MNFFERERLLEAMPYDLKITRRFAAGNFSYYRDARMNHTQLLNKNKLKKEKIKSKSDR